MPQMWPMVWELLFTLTIIITYTQINKFMFSMMNFNKNLLNISVEEKKINMLW